MSKTKKQKPARIMITVPDQELLKTLQDATKKYSLSMSTLGLYAIEAGLGFVLASLDDVLNKPTKK